MISTIKAFIKNYLQTILDSGELSADEAGIIARLIAYIDINLK